MNDPLDDEWEEMNYARQNFFTAMERYLKSAEVWGAPEDDVVDVIQEAISKSETNYFEIKVSVSL